jgi:hypothetical protein
MAARQERHQQTLQQVILADDQPPKLEQHLVHDRRGGRRLALRHG